MYSFIEVIDNSSQISLEVLFRYINLLYKLFLFNSQWLAIQGVST